MDKLSLERRAPRVLTVKEAAELLKLDRRSVYRLCRSGELKAIKILRDWRIPTEEIERILREGS